VISERMSFRNLSGGLLCPLLFFLLGKFLKSHTTDVSGPGKTLIHIYMIDYDIFTKLITRNCECER
jgi:hypothetical protein